MGKKQIWRKLLPSVVCSLVCMIGGVATTLITDVLAKQQIMARANIHVQRTLSRISKACIGVGLVILVIDILFYVRWLTKQRQQMAAQEQAEQQKRAYAEDNTGFDDALKRLHELVQDMPRFRDVVMQCDAQAKRMTRIYAKQKVLIEENDAVYIQKAIETLEGYMKKMQRNFRRISNLANGALDYQRLNMADVQKYIDNNNQRLSKAEALLQASVKHINNYDADTNEPDELEALLETMQQLDDYDEEDDEL